MKVNKGQQMPAQVYEKPMQAYKQPVQANDKLYDEEMGSITCTYLIAIK